MGGVDVDVDVDVDEVEWKKKENKRRWAPWKKLGAAAYCHLFYIDNYSYNLFFYYK